MPRKPQSEATKACIKQSEQDHVMDLAVAAYQAELAKTGPEKKKGLHAICTEISKEWWKKTGREVVMIYSFFITCGLSRGAYILSLHNTIELWTISNT
jgi:hypothetical protein